MQQSHASPDVKHANVCMKFGTHRSQLDSPACMNTLTLKDMIKNKAKSNQNGKGMLIATVYTVYAPNEDIR